MKVKKERQILIRLTKEEKEQFTKYCEEHEESYQRILRNYIKQLIKGD